MSADVTPAMIESAAAYLCEALSEWTWAEAQRQYSVCAEYRSLAQRTLAAAFAVRPGAR